MKPILFNTEMVRAILEGRKTVTRRLPSKTVQYKWDELCEEASIVGLPCTTEKEFYERYPPYLPGDILYARETWNEGYIEHSDAYLNNEAWFEEHKRSDERSFLDGISQYFYRADFDVRDERELHMRWRPSIHMPREAARIFLRVTDVRVERLQDIDEDGAIAEGLYKGWHFTETSSHAATARQAFMWLWMKLTRKRPFPEGWAANPWVWVIEFERCEKPEEG